MISMGIAGDVTNVLMAIASVEWLKKREFDEFKTMKAVYQLYVVH